MEYGKIINDIGNLMRRHFLRGFRIIGNALKIAKACT